MKSKGKGFDRWIEIFYGGRQFDSQGREYDGNRLIDTALTSFNPDIHTPPVVIGHPQSDKPAYGWVRELRKRFKNGLMVLEARLGQIAPEFEAAVRQGLYKKRSASFYPEGRLRHVGFLGAAPPAVKGLKDLEFEQHSPGAYFEFPNPPGQGPPAGPDLNLNPQKGDEPMNEPNDNKGILEILRSLFRAAREAGWTPPAEEPALKTTSQEQGPVGQEAELKKKEEELELARTEIAEEKARLDREKQEAEINSLVETKVREGVIPPAFVEMGLKDFLKAIQGAEEISFSDRRQNPVEAFLSFMNKAGDLGLFSEIATRDRISPDLKQVEADLELGDQIAGRVS